MQEVTGATSSEMPTERIKQFNMPLTTPNITMRDRSRPGSTTTALPIGANQDGCDKFSTGRANKITTCDNDNLKLPKSIITIGTWNVRILRRCVKLEELTNELKQYRYDIIGLAETSMTGTGYLTTYDGHKLYYSG